MAREKTDRRLAAIFCADVGTSIGSAALALARWPGLGREDLEHPIFFEQVANVTTFAQPLAQDVLRLAYGLRLFYKAV